MARNYDHYMILTSTNPRQVLLQASEQGYTGLEWEPEDGFWTQLMARVTNNFASEHLGLPVTLLEAQPGAMLKNNGRRVKIYFLEGHDPTWTPPAGSLWVDESELKNIRLAVLELKPFLQNWLAGPQKPELNQPSAPEWIKPGWLDEVENWVKEQLARQDVRLTGQLEQLKSWSISSVLRFPTDNGDYFFKATPQVFQKEPFFTAVLAEHFPNKIPGLTAIEPERGWMLMPDFHATQLMEITKIELWEAAARRYGRFQVASLTLTGTLLEKGCRDRRLDYLSAQLDAVIADTVRLVPNEKAGLNAQELKNLYSIVPILKAQISELDAFGLPMAVIHGDLNPHNIALTDTGKFIYYDWTDLSISHPFLDLDAFMEWGSPFEKEIPDWQRRVRQAYLEAWTSYLPMDQLERACELAAPLAIMVQALNYHWIVTKTDKSGSWDFEDFVPYHFRRLLELLNQPG